MAPTTKKKEISVKMDDSKDVPSESCGSTSDSLETASSEEDHDASVTDDTKRRSDFQYELESNWSLIFTDDTNSTDYDVRSNSSSNENEYGDNNNVSYDNEVGVISETDSESVTTSGSYKRRKRTNNDQIADSISTIKTDSREGSQIQFPDPIVENANKKKQPPSIFDSIKFGFNSVKRYVPYIVLGFLIIDKSIDLFAPVLFPLNRSADVLPGNLIEGHPFKDSKIHTITKFATTTLTLFLPGTTELVETVVPEATILYRDNGNNIEAKYENIDELPSWILTRKLFNNLVEHSSEVGESAVIGAGAMLHRVQEDSVASYKIISESIAQYLKEVRFEERAAEIQHNVEAGVSNVLTSPFWGEMSTRFTNSMNSVSSTVIETTKYIPRRSNEYYEKLLNSREYKQFLESSSKYVDSSKSKISTSSKKLLTGWKNVLNSPFWSNSKKTLSNHGRSLLNYDYSNQAKKMSSQLNKDFQKLKEKSGTYYSWFKNSDQYKKGLSLFENKIDSCKKQGQLGCFGTYKKNTNQRHSCWFNEANCKKKHSSKDSWKWF